MDNICGSSLSDCKRLNKYDLNVVTLG